MSHELLFSKVKLKINQFIDDLKSTDSLWNEVRFDAHVDKISDCRTSIKELITNFLEKTNKNPGQFLTAQGNFATSILGILNDRFMIAIVTKGLSKADGEEFKSYGELADSLINNFRVQISSLNSVKQELTRKRERVGNAKPTIDKFQTILYWTNAIRTNMSIIGAIIYPMQRTVVKVNAKTLNSQFSAMQKNREILEQCHDKFKEFLNNDARVPPELFESFSVSH